MENDWQRYSCQIALPGFDIQSQELLQTSSVLIVGAGGLGCPVAQYLASAGIGLIAIADHDIVSMSNLHRQILYSTGDIGKSKAETACAKLSIMNEEVDLVPINKQINSANVMHYINQFDIIVDCTDNIETKYLLNDACVLTGKPLVFGAAYQFDGQVSVWNVQNEDGSMSPNYRDVFPEINSAAVPSCAEGGVLSTVTGVIGCMQAAEVIKLITGCGELLSGKLLLFDGRNSSSKIIRIDKKSRSNITSLEETVVPKSISIQKLQDWMEEKEVDLIDVRDAEERARFHIGGMHVPLNEIHTVKMKTDKLVVVYCQSGRRSEQAVRILKTKFPTLNFYSLRGGINAWRLEAVKGEL